ncbi:phosphate acyltransferase [Henriciella pelagia]|jgi:glycerol-3-phosphate acyltransferase PlsX|uniref:Phosphate acyltransferase n=2 Tax=Hyphomonadaceae TaxID=69657 RepID=A0ABQ1J3F4_9PROT|nr:phosphate acyltransferase PlsX [Henriciella pelagia]GGB59126.1 phosphate acyltransferase [Henriciella pelagia]
MKPISLSVDAMGGDAAPDVVIDGLDLFFATRSDAHVILHGNADLLTTSVQSRSWSDACTIVDQPDVVAMDAKPSSALRRAKGTSMWGMIETVKQGEAHAGVSAGNTGALMAMSMLALRKMPGVHRPGMTAVWPTLKGRSVVLDVGANLDADAEQLVEFAVMGESYARAVFGKEKPTVGLLNIGSEEEKGRDAIKLAAELLRNRDLGIDFRGFIEGNDISTGLVDVVVTDGFTGNVALKTAEGTARLVSTYVRAALSSSLLSKAGAALAASGLRELKSKLNPSSVNGGVLLGLNGVIVKSHGGTDAEGFSTAVKLAADLAQSSYMDEVAAGLNRVSRLGTSPETVE